MVEVQNQQFWDDALEQLAIDAEAAAEGGADLSARLELASRWFSLCWLSCSPAWLARNCRASMALFEPVLAPPEALTDQVVASRQARAAGLRNLEQLQRPVAVAPVLPADVELDPPPPPDAAELARLARLERIRRPAPPRVSCPPPEPDDEPEDEAEERSRRSALTFSAGLPGAGDLPAAPIRRRRTRRAPDPAPAGWCYGDEAAELLELPTSNAVACLVSRGQLPPGAFRKTGARTLYNIDALGQYLDKTSPAGWLRTSLAAAELGITAAKLNHLRASGKLPPKLWRLTSPRRAIFQMQELKEFLSKPQPDTPELWE